LFHNSKGKVIVHAQFCQSVPMGQDKQ
jgi:hypothetical protein